MIALCSVPMLRLAPHDPVREATAAGFVYRCTVCGKARSTEEEFFGKSGYVPPVRKTFNTDRRDRERAA